MESIEIEKKRVRERERERRTGRIEKQFIY